MVKIPPKQVNGVALFQESAEALFAPVTHEELAQALDCSRSLVRCALRDPKSTAFRNPPAGWEVTMRRVLEARADYLTELARRLKARE